MKTELQKLLCTWLFNLAFYIMPTCNFKTEYCKFMKDNIMKF